MSHTQKLVLTPFQSPPEIPMATDSNVQFNSTVPKRLPQKHGHPQLERKRKEAQIYLKLAKIQGYDDDLRISDEYGRTVFNSDVISLVNEALKISDVLIGYDAFINLLYKARVDPMWIINENIKLKLMQMYNNQTIPKTVEPPPSRSSTPPPPNLSLADQPRKILVAKRRHEKDLAEEDAEDEWDEKDMPPNKKQWIYPTDSTENDDI